MHKEGKEGIDAEILARHMALVRLFSIGTQIDSVKSNESPSDRFLYFLDANVPIFFSDPIGNSFLLSVFKSHGLLNIPPYHRLGTREQSYIHAFATSEADKIPRLLNDCSTHTLRPHLLEINWYRTRLAQKIHTKLDHSNDDERDRENSIVENLAGIIRQADKLTDVNRAQEYFDILLRNYQDSIVKQIFNIDRLNNLVKSGILINENVGNWEKKIKVDRVLWEFLFSYLCKYRIPSESNNSHFSNLQDAESLALACQYSIDNSEKCSFLTFDISIIKVFYEIYSENPEFEVPKEIRAILPNHNFVRHPLSMSRFVCTSNSTLQNYEVNSFVEEVDRFFDIDKFFSSAKNPLFSAAFRGDTSIVGNFSGADKLLEKIENDLLFVHEESAVAAYTNMIGGHGWSHHDDSLNRGDKSSLIEACKLVDNHLNERSKEKNEELFRNFLLLTIADHGTAISQHRLIDEANIILTELDLTEDSALDQAPKQLLRNWPGWIKFTVKQIDMLWEMRDRTDEFIDKLSSLPKNGPPDIWLLIAVVTALKGDWALSERHAQLALDLAEFSNDDRMISEALYWSAVSIHYQTNPGMKQLNQAREMLIRAQSGSDVSSTNLLKYKTEALWIDVFLPLHQEIYGEVYQGNTGAKHFESLYDRAKELDNLFYELIPAPYDFVKQRLAIHISSCLCLLDLLSLSPKNAFGKVEKVKAQLIRTHLEKLTRFADHRRITVPIRIRFLILALQYVKNPSAKFSDEIKSFLQSDDDALIPFDRTIIENFLKEHVDS